MISKSQLTFIRSLQQKKFRSEHGLFVAEGDKLVLELLQSNFVLHSVYATKEWLKKNAKLLPKDCQKNDANDDELAKISSLVSPQAVVAVAAIPTFELEDEFILNNFSIFLDGIRDPGNLGTIVRVADWFGIKNIVCSPDCADVWNSKVVQASMGSILRVNVHFFEAKNFVDRLKKYASLNKIDFPPVYGTFMTGENIFSTKFGASGIVVIGNESNGIREETEQMITNRITIPSWKAQNDLTDRPESLNAAIAMAIVCSEIRRN